MQLVVVKKNEGTLACCSGFSTYTCLACYSSEISQKSVCCFGVCSYGEGFVCVSKWLFELAIIYIRICWCFIGCNQFFLD